MGNNGNRVSYREGQRLRAADLAAEQSYLAGLERRHNLTLHSPGVVLGLDAREGWFTALERRPGVAIDALGRALLLAERPGIVVAPAGKCVDSWLIYCEAPEHTPQFGRTPCGPKQSGRLLEYAQVVAIPVDPDSAPQTPVQNAVYLGRTGCNKRQAIVRTAVVSAQTLTPRCDIRMLVGPETGRDRDGFAVRVGREADPRIAIDRLGVNRLYGTVTLSDYRACARVALPGGQTLIFEATDPGDAGQQMHVRFQPLLKNKVRSLQVNVFSGLNKLGEDLVIRLGDDVEAKLKTLQRDSLRVETANAALAAPEHDAAATAPAPPAPPPPNDDAFFDTEEDLSLNPCGGMLHLEAWPAPDPAQQPVKPRGCLPAAQVDTPVRGPNGLSFLAMPAAPKAPPLPGVSAVQTGDAAHPEQQLRLDLGEKRDNDTTVRLSLGARDTAKPFVEWLHVPGVGGMSINATAAAGNTPPVSLRVTGKIERAPIKADPADSNFTSLLVQAWLAGLQRSVQASTVIDLALNPLPPSLIETGKPWSYKVVITNRSGKEITADGVQETQTIAGKPAPPQKTISGAVTIPVGGQANFTVNHNPNDTPSGVLTVEVRVFGKIGNSHWWKSVTTAAPIAVVDQPVIDLSGIPDSVPPGAAWDQSFAFRNDATLALTLNSVTLAENNSASQSLLLQPVGVLAGGSQPFGPLHHAAASTDRTFTVTANYTWTGGLNASLDNHKTVPVKLDLKGKLDVSPLPQVNTPWTFDLKLTNHSGDSVTLHALRQRIGSSDFATTAYTAIPLPANPTIDAGELVLLGGVHGVLVPSATDKIQLEIDMEYERGGTTFHPDTVTKEIDVQ